MVDVEKMVNTNSDIRCCMRERAAAKKRENRIRKMRMRVYAFAIISIFTTFLGIIGATNRFATATVSVVSLALAFFFAGLYFEVCRRK